MNSGKPKKIYVPERGDIVRLDFSPHQGHEQGFERPAIILSPRCRKDALTIVRVALATPHFRSEIATNK